MVAKSTVLNVICNLVDVEKIPPLLPFVVEALNDKRFTNSYIIGLSSACMFGLVLPCGTVTLVQ